jgi:hypothetical protein
MLANVERRPIDPRRLARIRQGRARHRYEAVLNAWALTPNSSHAWIEPQ